MHPIWEGTSTIRSLGLLRAIDRIDAHEAVFDRVDWAPAAVDHRALAALADRVSDQRDRLEHQFEAVGAAGDAGAQYATDEGADRVYDLVAAALLLAKAQRRLTGHDDVREAAVARWFVRETLAPEGASTATRRTMPSPKPFSGTTGWPPLGSPDEGTPKHRLSRRERVHT